MSLRLGTRRSKLALAQANEVAEALRRAAGVGVEIVPMATTGDRAAAAPAPGSAGRKGLFVGEIVTALQNGGIDLAVHSAKDLPAEDPEGVVIGAVPPRASPFDVLVTRQRDLPSGAVVGTGSIRRSAQLALLWPQVRVVDVRGNVDTRLGRLAAGDVDGLVLAAAGLARLGIDPPNARTFEPEEMLPAPGQGALAVQVRSNDGGTRELVNQIDDRRSRLALEAERALMAALGGGCDLPLGGLATDVEAGAETQVALAAAVIDPAGSRVVRAEASASTPGGAAAAVAALLREGGADEILSAAASGSQA